MCFIFYIKYTCMGDSKLVSTDMFTMCFCVSILVSFPRVVSSLELRSRDGTNLGKDTEMDTQKPM